mgnify:CR=1 FL=1
MILFEKLQKLIEKAGVDSWSEFYATLEAERCIDPEYLKHTAEQNIAVVLQNVESMSVQEVCTWLTWILRGERFCDGLFESCIKNGSLQALLKRGVEIENLSNMPE